LDIHESKEAALAVCGMLMEQGLGGEGIHFPFETWVEEVLPSESSKED